MFVLEFLGSILVYLLLLPVVILSALTLNPRALEILEQEPMAGRLVAGVVFLAGMSTLLGESSILFVNRVRRGRFVISLITNGIVFLISYFVWGLTVYIVARILFSVEPPIDQFMRMVGLSTAPLVFGFLVLIPWMGPFIGKLLSVWSLLILTNIVAFEFQIGFWSAVLCVGLGWVVSLVFSNTVGRPVVALRNEVFALVSGARMDVQADDILLTFAGASLRDLPVAPELMEDLHADAEAGGSGGQAEVPADGSGGTTEVGDQSRQAGPER
jgi:hypothetical protein